MKETVKTDKNVPFPKTGSAGRPSKYPWRTMARGESFVFGGNLDCARSGATYYTTRSDNKVFRARALDGVVRVWRLR